MERVPDEVRGAVDELATITREAIDATQLKITEVARKAGATRYPVMRLRNGTWLEYGLSKHMLKRILCAALEVDEATWQRAERLFDQINRWRKPNGNGRGRISRIVRYGRTQPFPAGRAYASIDRFQLDRLPGERVEGVIERIEPEARRGAPWQCAGRFTANTLLLSFWPITAAGEDSPQSDSDGVMVIQREATQGRAWPGAFIKLERHAGGTPRLLEYPYWLALANDRHLVDASSTVALLDFDNTLASGWVIERWVHALADAQLGQAGDGAQRLDRLFEAYRADPAYGHDRLAQEAAAIYASSLCGLAPDELAPLAETLVAR